MHPNARPLVEARRQLQLLQHQQEQLVPALYRDLALYLQVLRDGLLPAVQQACFHLATQVHPERYAGLAPGRRRLLQERLRQLSQRCGCLLTVEQLLGLAGQLERRRLRRERAEQRRLLEVLAADVPEAGASGEGAAAGHPGGDAGDPGDAEAAALPAGSISLGLELPLSADLFLQGLPGLADLPALAEAAAPLPPAEAPAAPASGGPAPERSSEGQQLFQALFALAAEGLGQGRGAGPAAPLEAGAEAPSARGPAPQPSAAAAAGSPATDTLLPRDPAALLRWWDQLDRALERRLRNLSHALNLELMRLGLSRSLLPPNLLDAVLAGQVEPHSAPANLLRLPLPAGSAPPEGVPRQLLAVLLRASDLEHGQPRLRSCRRRLEQRRRDLRTMAQRHRYWQQRALALQAEQQWLQDSAPTPTP